MISQHACRVAALATMVVFTGCSSGALFGNAAKAPVATVMPKPTIRPSTGYVPNTSVPEPDADPAEDAAHIQLGNGRMVAQASGLSAGRAGAGRGETGETTLNFNDASLQEVIDSVLGQILQVNYTIDPKLQVRITMQTSRPLARADILPTLESVLQAHGVALVKGDGLYRVVPLAAAAQSGPAAASGAFAGGQGGYGLQVIPLKFASARQLQKLLEPFVPAGSVLQVDDGRNLLLLSGTQQDIASFTRLVNLFDVDSLRGMSYGLVSLKQGSAVSVAREIGTILNSGAEGPLSGIVRVVPISRINAILLVSPQPAYIQQATDWIERLDNGTDESAPRIYVYNVQNSRAADMAKVLSDMFGNVRTVQPSTLPGASIARVESAAGSATLLQGAGLQDGAAGSAAGGLSGAIRGGAAVSGQEAPSAQSGSNAAMPADLPTVSFGNESGTDPADRHQTRIVADEKNNALVILAQPREYRMIEDALKRLDVLPQQVLIEATIAEVTLNDDLQYGVQWFLKNGRVTSVFSRAANAQLASLTPGFGQILATGNTQVILSALSAVTNVNVVSAPQLMVLDHQTAILQVGDEVPIAVQQARSVVNPDAPIVNTLQLRSTGVILKVTPRVNSNGIATLEIEQEVSDVARTTSSNIDSPTIQQRRVRSVVAASDNQTIALGGLIRENKTTSKSGIPILSDVPILGNLVSTTSQATTRTELLILLTPRVVRNPEEARAVTEELQQRMQGLQPVGGVRP